MSCFRNHVGTGSNEQDLAGRLNNNFEISSVTGSNDVSGGTSRGRMSGGAAEAVLARISLVATLLLK